MNLMQSKKAKQAQALAGITAVAAINGAVAMTALDLASQDWEQTEQVSTQSKSEKS